MSTPVKKVPIHLQSAQNRLLVKHGKVVNEDEITEEDVYIEDGIIKQIGKNLIIPGGTRVIDARGKLLLPGGIDPHTHLEMDFMGTKTVDDFYQGTKAAIAGGTTMIIDFVFPKKGETLIDAFYDYRQRADNNVCCDYGLHVAVTNYNEQTNREMEILCKEHGVNSFKSFMAYEFMLNDGELYSIFETCQKLGAIAQIHAENGSIITKNVERLLAKGVTGPEGHQLSRPEDVEAEAVNRACVIAKQVNAPLYVTHVTSEESGRIIEKARKEGRQVVYGEVLACNIGLVGDRNDIRLVTAPGIRSKPETPSQLLQFLASDVLQVTGSDNCTFTKAQKEVGKEDFSKIPNGVNGVEDRMSVIWEKGVQAGIIDPCRFVAITSTNAAKIFNIYPRKGYIGIGSDADIVIWDPNRIRTISASTHHQAVDFNIFEGMVCHGVADFVIVNGRVCLDEGQLRVVQGYGRFVETPVYPPFVYDPENVAELKSSIKNGANHGHDLDQAHYIQHHGDTIITDDRADSCSTPTLAESAVSTPTCRGARPEGQRDLQHSTFSISEELDGEKMKSCIRVRNPPGGKSSGFW